MIDICVDSFFGLAGNGQGWRQGSHSDAATG
jgi:hypothetical protein